MKTTLLTRILRMTGLILLANGTAGLVTGQQWMGIVIGLGAGLCQWEDTP